jgi:hypothetical protein
MSKLRLPEIPKKHIMKWWTIDARDIVVVSSIDLP